MKKNLQFKHLLHFVFLLLLSANSCQDEIVPKIPEISEVETEKSLVTSNCFLHVANYNDYGTLFYDYLKYHIAANPPEDFLPSPYKQDIIDAYASAKNELANMDLPTRMTYQVSQGYISSAFNTEYLNFYNDVDAMLAASTGLDEVIQQILLREQNTLDLTGMSCAEQETILLAHSATRYFIQYLSELWGNNGENYFASDQISLRDCGFFEAIGCFVDGFIAGIEFFPQVLQTVIVTGGIVSAVASGPFAGIAAFVLGEVVLGTIPGIANTLACCQDLNCHEPMGVSLRFASCNPTATYTPFGFGSDDTSLGWVNLGGTPAAATTPTTAPSLVITQNSPNTPVRSTITSTCSDGSTNASLPFTRNLSNLVLQVLGVQFTGPTKVNPPSGHEYTYSLLGMSNNANYTTQWFISNGTIVNSTNNLATVIWNTAMEEGQIQAQVQVNCPGSSHKLFTLIVTGDGPIP